MNLRYIHRCSVRTVLVLAMPAMLAVATATVVFAAPPLMRLAADFQNLVTLGGFEVTTTALPGSPFTGGKKVYTNTVNSPTGALYVTFSGAGDTHDGSALLMTAIITDSSANAQVCNPMVGGGDPAAGPPGWITLLKLPQPPVITNCNDGGGGSADCHDNNLYFSCCVQVKSGSQTVDIRLASSTGGQVFYERSTIYIDATPGSSGKLCRGVGLPGPN